MKSLPCGEPKDCLPKRRDISSSTGEKKRRAAKKEREEPSWNTSWTIQVKNEIEMRLVPGRCYYVQWQELLSVRDMMGWSSIEQFHLLISWVITGNLNYPGASRTWKCQLIVIPVWQTLNRMLRVVKREVVKSRDRSTEPWFCLQLALMASCLALKGINVYICKTRRLAASNIPSKSNSILFDIYGIPYITDHTGQTHS